MLSSKELRAKAWASLKGKYWSAFAVILVVGTLSSIGSSLITGYQEVVELANLFDKSKVDSVKEIGSSFAFTGVALVMGFIGFLISIFVDNAANVGLCNYFIKNTDSKPSFKDAFSGFMVRYGRNIYTLLLVGIKVILWSFLFVIPGIIKIYEYAIIPYILADDPEISSKEAFEKAKQMMKGNKWRLFKLNFSFIGWILLSALTLGIGTFFLIPYVDAANAEFYVELKNK